MLDHLILAGDPPPGPSRLALEGACLPFRPKLAPLVAGYHRHDGYDATKALVAASPTRLAFDGIVCANDLVAQGAIRALHTSGYRVPDDVAVVGFDDIEEGRYSTPTLSAIAQDKRQIAVTAVDLLLSRIGGNHDSLQDGSPITRSKCGKAQPAPHRTFLRITLEAGSEDGSSPTTASHTQP